MAENAPPPQEIRQRRVFYIPGYDPIHPRRYRELYRKEGAAQAQISGYEIGQRPKSGDGPYGWNVTLTSRGQTTQAQIEVLVWSDIVRASMSNSILATYGQLLRTAWEYIATGALGRLMKLRKGPVIAALYPVGFLLLQLLLALLAGWAVYAFAGLSAPLIGGWAVLIGLALGAGTVWGVLNAFRNRDGKLYAYYLMHDYAYSARYRGANPPELERRMAEFGDILAAALAEGSDEVLVVGHSSGAHLAVSILADLIRDGRVPDGARLSFLSLGQVVPMVSFLREAHRLRADLNYLAASDRLTWVDVTAPGDGCAFALCDPVSVSGVAPDGKLWPLVFSAQFSKSLSEEKLAQLKRRYFRLHFQYLCAFDRPLDYDYFLITAGPLSLGTRYDSRPPSNSRIETPVNKFTSTQP